MVWTHVTATDAAESYDGHKLFWGGSPTMGHEAGNDSKSMIEKLAGHGESQVYPYEHWGTWYDDAQHVHTLYGSVNPIMSQEACNRYDDHNIKTGLEYKCIQPP